MVASAEGYRNDGKVIRDRYFRKKHPEGLEISSIWDLLRIEKSGGGFIFDDSLQKILTKATAEQIFQFELIRRRKELDS